MITFLICQEKKTWRRSDNDRVVEFEGGCPSIKPKYPHHESLDLPEENPLCPVGEEGSSKAKGLRGVR